MSKSTITILGYITVLTLDSLVLGISSAETKPEAL